MNRPSRMPLLLVLALAVSSTACGERARDTARTIAEETRQGIAEATAEGGEVDKAIEEARKKLHTENLSFKHKDGGPKAELTPEGEFLIDGDALPFDAAQRDAALAYRKEVLAIADAGMDIGRQGAALGGEAAALAIRSIFGGGGADAADAKARIEAEAKKIEAAAKTLCRNVEGLETAQVRFAELVPEFRPYEKTININGDCKKSDATAGDADASSVDEAVTTDTVRA